MFDKSVLVFSALEPWSMGANVGAPSLYQTLKGYLAAGARVIYLTNRKRSGGSEAHAFEIPVDLEGIEIERFDFEPSVPERFSRLSAKMTRLRDFPRAVATAVEAIVKREKVDLLYAYESAAALALPMLRRRLADSIPSIARFQGTILGARYANPILALRKLETTLSLRVRADAYIMTDDGTLGDQAIRYWNRFVDSDNLLFVRNGITPIGSDTQVGRPAVLAEVGLGAEKRYLLTVCRLAEWKRVDRAIRVMAALAERFVDVDLIVCGEGPARPALERLAGDLKVHDRVHFIGGRPRKYVDALMRSVDIFLSLYDVSNCGNPLFEALLAGKPLVTLNNGGTGTVIRDGENGRIIDPDNEDLLPATVAEMLADPAQMTALSSRAQSWAAQNLTSWEERMEREIRWLQRTIPSIGAANL